MTPAPMVTPQLRWLHLLAWCACAIALWALHEPHYEFSDPIAYMRLASDIGNMADWSMDNPFQHRLALVGLHAVSLQIFGATPLGVFLPQLGIFLLCIAVVSAFCRNHLEQFIANLTILVMLPQARTIFPDMAAGACMVGAMLAMAPRAGYVRGVLFSLLAVAAFLFKETAIFIVLPFVVIFAADACDLIRQPARRQFYLAVMLTGFGLLALYLLCYFLIWGDAFLRISSVSSYGQLHLWSLSGRMALLERLFVEPLPQMQRIIGPAFILSLLAATYYLVRPRIAGQGRLTGPAYVAVFHLGWLVAFAFGTTSFSSYQPLPFLDRMLDPVVLTTAILCAYASHDLAQALRPTQARSAIALTLVCIALIGHKSLGNIASSLAFSYVSNVHEARSEAAALIQASPRNRLVVAERRTRTLFPIYTNYTDTRDLILECPRLSEALDAEKAAYLVDYRAVTLVGSIHGVDTCAEAVRAAARRAGARIIYDDDRVFFAIRSGS